MARRAAVATQMKGVRKPAAAVEWQEGESRKLEGGSHTKKQRQVDGGMLAATGDSTVRSLPESVRHLVKASSTTMTSHGVGAKMN